MTWQTLQPSRKAGKQIMTIISGQVPLQRPRRKQHISSFQSASSPCPSSKANRATATLPKSRHDLSDISRLLAHLTAFMLFNPQTGLMFPAQSKSTGTTQAPTSATPPTHSHYAAAGAVSRDRQQCSYMGIQVTKANFI